MSNRLTFSLASLVLIFAMVFVTLPVMGHDGHADPHPIVTITKAPASVYTAPAKEARDDYRIKISVALSGSTDITLFGASPEIAGSEIAVQGFTVSGTPITGTFNPSAVTQPDPNKAEWIATVDLTDTSLGATARSIRVTVAADAITAAHQSSIQANEATSRDFGGLPVVRSETVAVTVAANTGTAAMNDYTVTFTFSDTATIDNFDLAQVVTTPVSAKTSLGLTAPTSVATNNVFTMPVALTFDVQTVTVGVDPNFAKATAGGALSVLIPPAAPPTPATQADPTVSIMVDMLDTAERTFRVDVTSTPGAKSDGSKPDAQPVIHANLEVKDAADAVITTTIDEEDTVTNPTTNVSRYVAILKYGLASNVPASVGLKSTFKTANTVPPAMFDGTTPTDPTVDPPAMPAAPSASINANNDLIIDVMWTAVTGADEYIIKKYMGTTLVKTFPDDDPNTAMITASPYMVGPVPAADRGMSFTFTVTAKNAGGESDPSPVSAAVMVPAAPPATTNNAPAFPTGSAIADIVIWKGNVWTSPVLPKATDDEGDVLQPYTITPDLPDGLRLTANDAQDRFIEGTATAASAKTPYKFIATDSQGVTAELSFSITVLEPIVPTMPTGVTAMEEGDLGFPNNILRRTVNTNKVVVNFVAPVDTTVTSHNPAIPFGAPITGYKVYRKLAQSSATYDYNKVAPTSFTTPVLSRGMHMFEVAAVNSVGDGAKSTPAAEALVADPPGQATDLRASKVPAEPNSVTLDWLKPKDDGGADILGYFIYHTLDGASLPDVEIGGVESYQIKGLKAGRHVFRVAGFNSDGLGSKSISTEFSVDVPLDPTNAAPTFGTQSISAITATEGMPIEGITLPAATDPDGDAITYSIKEMSQLNGLTFNKETRFLSGTPTKAMASKVYTYQASDSKGKTASLNFTISVAAKYTPPQVDDGHLTATFAEGTGSVVGTTTIGGTAQAGVMIAGHGFATVGANDLTDLQEFLELGGTIGLSNGDAIDDKNSRTVVISEILWGLDFGAPVDDQTQWQFIELYNTTNAAINLTGWTLTFTEGRPVPASDIDRFSNRAGTGWNLGATHGQSGRVTGTTAVDADNTVTPVRITSMYRDINYDKVETEAAKATVNRGELVKGIPGGDGSGSWKASQRRSEYNRWIYDSRWDKHFKSTAILTASAVARTPFIINEVGNGSDDTNDWVEIRNVTADEASLKNYHLSVVTGFDTDTSLVNFHDKDIKVPENSVILLVNTDPKTTGIAAGRNAAVAEDDQELTGVTSRYYINSSLKLPDNGKFNLILRKAHDKLKTSDELMDVIGGLVVADATKGTSQWPLVATGAPHSDVVEANGRDLKSGYVYIRKNATGGTGEHHLGRAGYTGIGYDRDAPKSDANGGTPGYANDALKEKVADLSDGETRISEITISEIMVDTGTLRSGLPQWIELYNSSMTEAVNLNGWKLMIENSAGAEVSTFNATLTLDAMTISPNQTVLIVSTSGRTSDTDQFPSTRVVNLWVTKKHREELEMTRRTDQVFSVKGFHLRLVDKDNKTVDMVGNLDGNRRTRDEPTWVLPMSEEEGRRSSLIRRYDNKDKHRAGDGTISDGWVLASDTNLAHSISHTYYGNADDYGTPGYRGGGPLPVSLSKFRPERLDDGTIAVRWVTESELNNAGFNILRSEKRDGQFTQMNTSLIKGQGTTSERTTYSFPDTSAKPNVVYYYQIQDVSLDGKVTTLRQSRLKGHVSAAGKLTTTWGELKALQ